MKEGQSTVTVTAMMTIEIEADIIDGEDHTVTLSRDHGPHPEGLEDRPRLHLEEDVLRICPTHGIGHVHHIEAMGEKKFGRCRAGTLQQDLRNGDLVHLFEENPVLWKMSELLSLQQCRLLLRN
jgi:hypothetical protein